MDNRNLLILFLCAVVIWVGTHMSDFACYQPAMSASELAAFAAHYDADGNRITAVDNRHLEGEK
jgi:hypothetical protein